MPSTVLWLRARFCPRRTIRRSVLECRKLALKADRLKLLYTLLTASVSIVSMRQVTSVVSPSIRWSDEMTAKAALFWCGKLVCWTSFPLSGCTYGLKTDLQVKKGKLSLSSPFPFEREGDTSPLIAGRPAPVGRRREKRVRGNGAKETGNRFSSRQTTIL